MDRRAFLALGVLLPAAVSPRAAAADEFTELRKRGVLRVGTSGDYPPFTRFSDGRRTGLDMELATQLGKELGVRVEFVPFKWPALASMLDQGAFDVAASGVTVRADRLFFGRLSRPYAVTGAVACVRKADAARFRRIVDLDQPSVRIAVNRGGHLEQVARAEFPHAAIQPLDQNMTLFERVTSKAADAAVSDSAEAHAGLPADLSTIGPFTHDRKAFFVRRDAPLLAHFIDQWIFRHEGDGLLPRLRSKWLGSGEPLLFRSHLEAVLSDVELRFSLMPAVAAAKRAANLPVFDPAQEDRVLLHVKGLAKDAQLDPATVEALYRVLMRAAKIIQSAPVLSSAPTVTLDALRGAIGAVDEHLLSSLRAAAPRVPPNEWKGAAQAGIHAELLPASVLGEIGSALAAVHRIR